MHIILSTGSISLTGQNTVPMQKIGTTTSYNAFAEDYRSPTEMTRSLGRFNLKSKFLPVQPPSIIALLARWLPLASTNQEARQELTLVSKRKLEKA